MPENALGNIFSSPVILIVIMIAMFALMIIPQRRRDKKVKNMLKALKPGDRVRTIGGIYGTIGSIKDDIVTLVVGPDRLRLVILRGAISTVEDVAAENTMNEEIKEVQ
jgi:preprotein translocase subunit YajC